MKAQTTWHGVLQERFINSPDSNAVTTAQVALPVAMALGLLVLLTMLLVLLAATWSYLVLAVFALVVVVAAYGCQWMMKVLPLY